MIVLLLACRTEPPETGPRGDCPAGMVAIPAGEFEAGATGEQVGAAVDWPEKWNLPRQRKTRETGAFCIDAMEYPNEAGAAVKVFVGWEDAHALCEAAGKRLCREDEWTKACAGPEGLLFPYGDTYEEGRCNDAVEVGDDSGKRPAGSFPTCTSGYGVLDMQGNVSEWVADVHEYKDTMRVLRGGTMWLSIYGQGCMSRHAHEQHGPTHGDDGFRCCQSS